MYTKPHQEASKTTGFSIINPAGHELNEADKQFYSNVFSELKISQLLNIEPLYVGGTMHKHDVVDYFTRDVETIVHRQDIFEDLINCKGLIELLKDSVLPLIRDIANVSVSSIDDYYFMNTFYSVKRLSLYVECIEKLHSELSKLPLSSQGMLGFADKITSMCMCEDFSTLKTNLSKISIRLENIKSITVGMNLNYMSIESLGIVSLNEERFVPGKLIDKILSKDFNQSDGYTLLTPIAPAFSLLSDHVNSALAGQTTSKHDVKRAFNAAIEKTLKGTVKNIPKDISTYMKAQTQFLVDLLPEIYFLIAGYKMLTHFKEINIPICRPKISQTNETYIEDLLHPSLISTTPYEELVRNNITFDKDGMIYILTGANSGGKSVFLHSIGIAQILFQLGLYVPANKALMRPVDYLCLFLPTDGAMQNAAGRLEFECMALNEMIKTATSKSMILIDEVFSSTGVSDGAILAEELLKHFAKLGCRGIFLTHIHDLPVMRINEHSKTTVKVDTLVAITIDGTRTYEILRQEPDGKSYAKDIAKKYGLLVDIEE